MEEKPERHSMSLTCDLAAALPRYLRFGNLVDIMRVSKWGNSLAVRLPKDIVEAMALSAGDELRIVQAAAGTITFEKGRRRERTDRKAARDSEQKSVR